jgi:CubicO group peptidase (beta-lactamase class C family)
LLTGLSAAFGYQSTVGSGSPLYSDTKFRMGNSGEIYVATAILNLIATSVLPALDTAISANLLPGGITFANPSFPATSLTLRHLLTHTSTLTDARWTNFALNTPSTVLDLATFATSYFLTGTVGSYQVATDIWSSSNPGSSASYNYAKANIALLMFIVERATSTNNLVTSTDKTCLAYVAEKIWTPLGMSNTFVRTLTGGIPTSSYPAGVSVYASNSIHQDTTSAGTTVTAVTSIPLHPAYFAESMTYSTPTDMAKLNRALFLDSSSAFYTIGTTMRSGLVDLTSVSTASKVTAQKGVSLGLRTFDGSQICSLAIGTAVVSACPLSSTSNVWGTVHAGTYSQFISLCSDASASSIVFCTSIAVGHAAGTNAISPSLATVGSIMQLAFGDQTSSTVLTNPTTTDSLYPLWVALIVGGCLAFIFFAAWATEFIVGEAPVASGLVMPTNQLPGR